MVFRIFLDICYMREAPPPTPCESSAAKQESDGPASDTRTAFAERFTEESFFFPMARRRYLSSTRRKSTLPL